MVQVVSSIRVVLHYLNSSTIKEYLMLICFLSGSRATSPTPPSGETVEENADEDMTLAQIMRQSKLDYERSELLRKKEEEDLQRAINESMRSQNSQSGDDRLLLKSSNFR